VLPCRDAHVIGGIWNTTQNSNQIVQSDWAVDCTFEDAVCYRGSRAGQTVRWRNSLRCKAKTVKTVNDVSLAWDYNTMHGTLNRYMTVGTQDCVFEDCEDHYGAQSFDPTYGSGALHVNINTVIKDCRTYNSFEQAVTTHPATYNCWIEKTHGINCYRAGLVLRGLKYLTSATEDVVDDSGYRSRGIEAYEGGCRGLTVEGQ